MHNRDNGLTIIKPENNTAIRKASWCITRPKKCAPKLSINYRPIYTSLQRNNHYNLNHWTLNLEFQHEFDYSSPFLSNDCTRRGSHSQGAPARGPVAAPPRQPAATTTTSPTHPAAVMAESGGGGATSARLCAPAMGRARRRPRSPDVRHASYIVDERRCTTDARQRRPQRRRRGRGTDCGRLVRVLSAGLR